MLLIMFQAAADLCRWVTVGPEQLLCPKVLILPKTIILKDNLEQSYSMSMGKQCFSKDTHTKDCLEVMDADTLLTFNGRLKTFHLSPLLRVDARKCGSVGWSAVIGCYKSDDI